MKRFKYIYYLQRQNRLVILQLIFILLFSSCRKLVEVDPPITSITGANVFNNDATAIGVLTDVYAGISSYNINFGNEGFTSISLFAGLSADEISLYNLNNVTYLPYYRNDLTSNIAPNFWYTIYPIIFIANSAIEGINNSSTLTPIVKKQLLGEAKFIRAFCYFYLVNLYGNVCLTTTTDYKVNALLPRVPKDQVYKQIILDLKDAKDLLSPSYLDASLRNVTTERVRPTKWAATALLARVYLFTENWQQAESEADDIIDQRNLYNTVRLDEVFLKNSQEAIWQLQPVGTEFNANTGEGKLFVLPPAGPDNFGNPVYLSTSIVRGFEPNDLRLVNWVDSVIVDGVTPIPMHKDTFYFPYKYKIGRVNTTTQEYIMVLRLGEIFLIRAEARARQGDLIGAAADLNIIRSRGGLPNIGTLTQSNLLNAILHERKIELFAEWGHRWFDLKRTLSIDEVMKEESARKGGAWQPTDQLFPIPQAEMNQNPNLIQNEGY